MTIKNRAILISSIVILLCMSIIAGVAFGLFSDSITVRNHLKSGTLDVTLTRTNLTYTSLDNEGYLVPTNVNTKLELTHASADNVFFGENGADTLLVPGSSIEAELEIAHGRNSNVAFEYSVSLVLINKTAQTTELSKQLKVTVTAPDGTEKTAMLSELASGLSIATGQMPVGSSAQKFKVKVEFVDDLVYNPTVALSNRIDNDVAQTSEAFFDLVVTAVQDTEKN